MKEYNETSIKFNTFKEVNASIDEDQRRKGKERTEYLDELENEIIEDERKLRDLTNFVNDITDNLEHLNEKWAVFDKVSQLVAVNQSLVNALESQQNQVVSGPPVVKVIQQVK